MSGPAASELHADRSGRAVQTIVEAVRARDEPIADAGVDVQPGRCSQRDDCLGLGNEEVLVRDHSGGRRQSTIAPRAGMTASRR